MIQAASRMHARVGRCGRLAIVGLVVLVGQAMDGVSARAQTPYVPFTSHLYPYSISYPAGWRHFVSTTASYNLDQFSTTSGPGSQRASVTIVSAPVSGAQSTNNTALRYTEEQGRRQLGNMVRDDGTVIVNGERIGLFIWRKHVDDLTVIYTQAAFYTRGRLWSAAMTEGDAMRAHRGQFLAMLRSMRVRG